ncbi:thiopeptide-type bacteriocin biosynthesis protein [Micromonospora sp. NPDC003197]
MADLLIGPAEIRFPDAHLDALRTLLSPVLGDHTEAFLAGGLAALRDPEPSRNWVQVGIAPDGHRWSVVYAGLDEIAAELLDQQIATNFFFIHKPPGLRVRFEAAPGQHQSLHDALHARLDRLRPHLDQLTPGIYEPEQLLFGGPTAMPYVHRIFTADARAWLGYHQLAAPPSTWAFSLALVRQLLNGLRIAGWEDLEVWERIRRQAHRMVPEAMDPEKVRSVGGTIRALWDEPDRLRASLSAPTVALVDRWGGGIRTVAEQWHTDYFAGSGALIGEREALIGEREAAAFVTIFHWNRGRLSALTQALVAAALADRSNRP